MAQSRRLSPASIRLMANVRCDRVYPTEDTTRNIKELKTVGIRLSSDQAIHLARVLLAASQDWQAIDLTAYRLRRRQSDNTYQVTVTSDLTTSVASFKNIPSMRREGVALRRDRRGGTGVELAAEPITRRASKAAAGDYVVTKRSDRFPHCWFQIYRRKLAEKAKRGDFCVVVRCDFGSPSETVFKVPYRFLADRILTKARLEADGRYMFEVRKDTHRFVFHPNIQFDGNQFLANG